MHSGLARTSMYIADPFFFEGAISSAHLTCFVRPSIRFAQITTWWTATTEVLHVQSRDSFINLTISAGTDAFAHRCEVTDVGGAKGMSCLLHSWHNPYIPCTLFGSRSRR